MNAAILTISFVNVAQRKLQQQAWLLIFVVVVQSSINWTEFFNIPPQLKEYIKDLGIFHAVCGLLLSSSKIFALVEHNGNYRCFPTSLWCFKRLWYLLSINTAITNSEWKKGNRIKTILPLHDHSGFQEIKITLKDAFEILPIQISLKILRFQIAFSYM